MKDMDEDLKVEFMEKERLRAETIQRAVEAAEAVLDEYPSPTPDEHSYLLYKTGGTLLAKALEKLDMRVFMNDVMGSTSVKATFEPTDEAVTASIIERCTCGRRLDQFKQCVGCYKEIDKCNCRKQKTQA